MNERKLVLKYARRRLSYLGRRAGADNPSAAEIRLWKTVCWALGEGELPEPNTRLSTPLESLSRQLTHVAAQLNAALFYPASSSDTVDLYLEGVVACALAVRVLRRLEITQHELGA